jgi:hypothetical protein
LTIGGSCTSSSFTTTLLSSVFAIEDVASATADWPRSVKGSLSV